MQDELEGETPDRADGVGDDRDRISWWEKREAERQAASGRHGRGGHRCRTCAGTGRVPGATPRRGGTGYSSGFGACPECGGSGYVDDVRPEEDV